MNLLDAIKTGKPFKRKDWEDYHTKETVHSVLDGGDIIADDWMIKEKAFTITPTQLREAYTLAYDRAVENLSDQYFRSNRYPIYVHCIEELIEELERRQ